MARFGSFRVRLALLSVCLSGLVLAGFAGWAWYMVQRANLGRVDDSLREIAHRHLMIPHDPSHWAQVDHSLQFVFGEDTGRVVLLVVDSDGKLLYRTERWPHALRVLRGIPGAASTQPAPQYPPPDAPPPPPPPSMRSGFHPRHSPRGTHELRRPPPARGENQDRDAPRPPPPPGRHPITQLEIATLSDNGESWRAAVFRDSEVTIAIAVEMGRYSTRIAVARAGFLAAFILSLSLVAAGSWYLATRAMRPIGRLGNAIALVTARGLDQRVPGKGEPEEIQHLVAQFNRMMERLERSFAQAARFGADAAHELKTPLAVLQGEIEDALQSAPSEQQVVLSHLLDEVHRLKSITQKLLLLARADAGQLSMHIEPVDLSGFVRQLAEDIEISAPDIRVTAKIDPGITVAADRVLLGQALKNVVDNAVKYNAAGGSVEMTLHAGNGVANLSIANSGSIPAEKRERIFDRFVRVDDARTRRIEGAGLGLSLAREIARAHGGDLFLESSDRGMVNFAFSLRQVGGS
ncbi:MAG: ATP-binding protein [Candidatus Hydrogenedentes bacterium]|nr:ATP-binding protein [Candidatus Hydrogenedentota bacterium]